MKRVCTICERVSEDGNLWCQEPDCPAGAMPLIFGYGEWLADIEVIRLIRVLKTAALYEARRGKQKVLLKVAHDGCQNLLKQEAVTLLQLSQKTRHAMLPVLLPAYQQADITQRPYGKTVFQNETKYYEVFEYVSGEMLRDMLLKNPQPWHQHAAWLTISLADALAFLHLEAKKLHLSLNPESILVRTDKDGIPRLMLLDLGLLGEPQAIDYAAVNQYGLPSYTAPELLTANGGGVSYTADVYGLGLLLYEMFAGRPAYDYRERRPSELRQEVISKAPPPLVRTDLSEEIHGIVQQAIERVPERRQQDVRVFAKMLRNKFGEVPPEKKRHWDRRLLAAVALAGLIVIIMILVSALLG